MDKVMMNDEKWNTTLIKERLQNQDIKFQEMLLDVYVDSQKIEYQRNIAEKVHLCQRIRTLLIQKDFLDMVQ